MRYTCTWCVAAAQVGRAVGSGDDAAVSKLLKMTGCVALCAVAVTWAFYLPASPWLLKARAAHR